MSGSEEEADDPPEVDSEESQNEIHDEVMTWNYLFPVK